MPAAQTNVWIVPTIAILLCIYAIVALIVFAGPARDFESRRADGLLVGVIAFLVFLGGVLWFASHPHRPFLLWILLLLTAYPAVMYVARQIYLFIAKR